MKVLHICLASFYIDNYSYQENLLPIYHKKMGYDVEIIASLFNFDKNGIGYFEKKEKKYFTEDNIQVTRLEFETIPLAKRLRLYKNTYEEIVKSSPDIIFIHGCQFLDIRKVYKYKKNHPDVKIYVDNHADFSNSARNWFSKNILHKIIWRYCAKKIESMTEKFYGVLPARVDFLNEVYKINSSKIELLVMGADDDKVKYSLNESRRLEIREKLKVSEDQFLIVTGGKIDLAKKQVLNLMKGIQKLNNSRIKLVVYGSIVPEMKKEVMELIHNNENIAFIGWLNTDDSYDVFSASDLIVFPGRHSVYWEQAVAMGKPIMIKHWQGTTHVDIGGNCIFLYNDSIDEITEKIYQLVANPKLYQKYLDKALNPQKNQFLYSNIAKSSLQLKANDDNVGEVL